MNDKKQNVVLTGFMGTGKTTVGRFLAAELGYALVDTDKLIAQRAGKPIHLIFKEDGEAVFRDWEAQLAAELTRQKQLVIATGGGMLVSERNAEIMQEAADIFCLTASPREILSRVKLSGNRPLLDTPKPLERIKELLAEREAAYGRFTQIKTSLKKPQRIAKEIVKALQKSEKSEK